MTSIPHAMADTPPPENAAAKPIENKRLRYFELCMVLLIALSQPLLSGVYVLLHGPGAIAQISPFRWVNGVIHEILALVLLGYVLARRRRRFGDLGLRWSLRDCGVGVIVAVVSFIAYFAGGMLLQLIHYAVEGVIVTTSPGQALWAHPGLQAVPYFLVTPFFEELIVRAYVMTEMSELTGSSVAAIGVSVLVQTSYHLYYGWFGVLFVVCPFLVFALYYARYRRALPVIVAHGMWDLIGLIRFW